MNTIKSENNTVQNTVLKENLIKKLKTIKVHSNYALDLETCHTIIDSFKAESRNGKPELDLFLDMILESFNLGYIQGIRFKEEHASSAIIDDYYNETYDVSEQIRVVEELEKLGVVNK